MDLFPFGEHSYKRAHVSPIVTHSVGNENQTLKRKVVNCRLCLSELQDGTITALDGIVKDMLEIVLPELNMSMCVAPSICKSCLETLKQSYSFKSCCLEAEDKVQEFANPHSYVDLKKVLSKAGIKEISGSRVVCRTCLGLKDSASITRLNSYEGDPLQNMVEKCLPEMGLNVTKDPSICSTCLEQLEEQFHFIMQCLDTEAKINFYSERKHVYDNIDLYNVCLFAVCIEETDEIEKYSGKTETLVDCDTDRLMLPQESFKEEKCNGEVIDLTDEYLSKLLEEKRDPYIEEKPLKAEKMQTEVQEAHPPPSESNGLKGSDSDVSVTDPSDLLEVRKVRKVRDMASYRKGPRIVKPQPTANTKPDYRDATAEEEFNDDEFPKKRKRLKQRKCKSCNFKTKFASRMKAHMTVNHPNDTDPPEESAVKDKELKCWRCQFKATTSEELSLHRSQHIRETQYQCPHCPMVFVKHHFYTKHVENHRDGSPAPKTPPKKLNRKRKDSQSKVGSLGSRFNFSGQFFKMFKCRLCPYQTRSKDNYSRHQLGHKKPTEIVTHKCKECNFETIQKENFMSHMQSHELDDANRARKCFLCSFQTTNETALKTHVNSVHKSNVSD